MSIGRVLTWQAARDPDAPAVRDEQRELSRRELDRLSNRWARRLQQLGVGVDDVVTLGLESTVGFVVLCAAVWKAGATPQPLHPALDVSELRGILELTGPALVVGFDDVELPGVARLASDALADEPDTGDGPLPDLHAASWKAPVSGGSTGRPKVIFSGSPATVDPEAPTATYIPASATQLVPVPLHHSAAFLFAMRGLFLGHALVLLRRFDARAAVDAITGHQVTWTVLTPPLMARVHDLGPVLDEADLTSLEAVLHVGAPCPPWLKRAWIERLGPQRVHEIYAGTESIGVAFIDGEDWLDHPGSVGRPAAGSSFRILDEHGREVPTGTVGEVFLLPRGGPGSTYRYLGSDSRPVDGYESLGDLGWLDDDGYLYLADRSADVVTTADGPVYPSRVEAALDAHPRVRSSAVVGRRSDGATHDHVHAVVDIADTHVTADELLLWATARLPEEMRPRTYDIVHDPLRDEAGKVRRSAWRQPPRRSGPAAVATPGGHGARAADDDEL